jgi:hypothetical protein
MATAAPARSGSAGQPNPYVVELIVEPRQRCEVAAFQRRFGPLAEIPQPGKVAGLRGLDFIFIRQAVPAEMADRVEEPVAHLPVRGLLHLDERLIDKPAQDFQNCEFVDVAAGSDPFGRGDIEAALENSQTTQYRSLGRIR